MAYGIQLLGGSSQYAITDSYKNPQLALKSTATTVTEPTWDNASRLSITYTRTSTSDSVLCFLGNTTGLTGFIGTSESGNDVTWTYFTDMAVGTVIDYYIFSDAVTPAADTYGIHIYNAAGTRTFSSAGKPLRLTSVSTRTIAWGTSVNLTYTTGRNYAVAQVGYADATRYVIMGDVTWVFVGGCKVITDGINIGTIQYATSAGDGTGFDYNIMRYLVCDVTGY